MIILDELISSIDKDSDIKTSELLKNISNNKIIIFIVSIPEAIYSIRYSLNRIKIFHTDRGREFDNKSIDKILDIFGIERTLIKKGSPYDNAVSEVFNKVLKQSRYKRTNLKFKSVKTRIIRVYLLVQQPKNQWFFRLFVTS